MADEILDSTPNSSQFKDTDDELQAVLQYVRTQTIVLSITMLITLIGNLFLALLIVKMAQRRLGPVHILILHTCLADICFALFTALPQMASTLTFPYFYGGDLLCRLVKYLQLVPMYASPYLLVAISIDRYVAICKPLVALKWKYGLVHTLAGIAWTASLLFSIPNIFNFHYTPVQNNSGAMACMGHLDAELERAWITVFVLLVWLLPSLVVGVLYALVCATVWKSMRCANNQATCKEHLYKGTRKCGAKRKFARNLSNNLLRKTQPPSINSYKLKTVKLTMTIVLANFILWAPFCIINVVETYFPDLEMDYVVATCIVLVGNANSCVNPWIYLIFNYKRVFDILCGSDKRSNRNHLPDILSLRRTRTIPSRKKSNVVNECTDSRFTVLKNQACYYDLMLDARNSSSCPSTSITAKKRYSVASSLDSVF